MPPSAVTEYARAKVNLTLHVGALIEDKEDRFYGYHPVDSLVVFADVADKITLTPALETSLSISGQLASSLEVAPDNLILKAVERVREKASIPEFSIHLEKNIPVSAGLGGGSANAAAVLRALENFCDLPETQWHEIALSLGADVPVCRLSQTAHMAGIGERVTPWKNSQVLYAILINPLVGVSTGAVFKAFDSQPRSALPAKQINNHTLLGTALAGTNDLQRVAMMQLPLIDEIIAILSAQKGCELARMSGSGASCFAIFETQKCSQMAMQCIIEHYPQWWVVATCFDAKIEGE
ncbi:MAG: 4-(cytidine 5'-diphospho)-2-C-methyl-D-erythritol kinase [Maricaulaceae bacterium]